MRDPCKLRQCFQIPRYFIFAWVGFNLVAFHVIISLYKVTGRTRRRASDLNSLQLYKQNCFLFSSPPPPFICQAYNFPSQARQKGLFRSDSFAVVLWCSSGRRGPGASFLLDELPMPEPSYDCIPERGLFRAFILAVWPVISFLLLFASWFQAGRIALTTETIN